MQGAYLPGNSTVELKKVPVPKPGYGQVLVKTGASTICGSDIRAIYKEHLGKGAEAYQNVIAGHEPSGKIVELGSGGIKRFKKGDRVIIYHISGCGICTDCRQGYMISCSSNKYRKAYGWQRDGGMADYIVADEKDLVALPDQLNYIDGAQIACGFGTVYEGLCKISFNGTDTLLVTGLGPVGLATCMLAKKMGAIKIYGTDISNERVELAKKLNLVTHAFVPESNESGIKKIISLTGGGVSKAVDCSGNTNARQVAIRSLKQWGKVAFVGEGSTVEFNPSPDIIHKQISIYGSWVTSIWRMEELANNLVLWNIHPADLVTDIFSLNDVDKAYKLMAKGISGKVAVVFDE
jgi:threonine dehydrogenase-like Zn-dependent dehydrogenase